MELSFEGEVGIVLALVGLAGAGAIMIAPTHTWIGWTLIALAATGACVLILFHLGGKLPIRSPLIVAGMIVCGAGFLGFAGTYFWPASKSIDVPHEPPGARSDDTVPPIGSLRFVTATLEIEFKQSTGQTAATIKAELHNDSNRPISFHAVTAGNINGIAFDVNKVEFDGYTPAHESSFLISNRVTDVPINEQTDIKDPNVVGIYEYDLAYRYTGEEKFVRRSARGLKIVSWSIIKREPVGTVTKMPISIIIYNVVEE